jgi:hypothetical protein
LFYKAHCDELAEALRETHMAMRRLKKAALCFGLTAAMLAGQDVSRASATPAAGGGQRANFWLRSQKAFGGANAWSNYSKDVADTVRTCSLSDKCRARFGKHVGPEDLENVRNWLNGGPRE